VKDVERTIVAVTALATPVEAEAKALAADLGTIAYEERLKLTAGLPAIVLATTDAAAAQALLAKLRARGHRALLCRASDVVPASAMVSLRRFALDDEGLASGDAHLPWDDISALVRARHLRSTTTTETVKEKKFDLGRAVMTGGLVMRKAQSREVVTRTEDTEQVLYLFRTSGETPWLLREHETHYGALGAALAPTATRNFTIAVDTFRARAPQARFDDGLVRRPTLSDVDLYAHLVATAG
jgi:hypothetical protein